MTRYLVQLKTLRLVIRFFTLADIPAYAAIVADPRVTKHLSAGVPHTYAEAEAYIRDVVNREQATGIARYAVVRKLEHDLIGFCGFKDVGKYVDFGWRYKHDVWGQGYGTEAARAVLDYGLKELELTNIVAGTAFDNTGSLRIIEKLGFKRPQYSTLKQRKYVKFYQT